MKNHIKIGVFLAPQAVKQSKFFRAISTKASKKRKRPRTLKKQKGHTPQWPHHLHNRHSSDMQHYLQLHKQKPANQRIELITIEDMMSIHSKTFRHIAWTANLYTNNHKLFHYENSRVVHKIHNQTYQTIKLPWRQLITAKTYLRASSFKKF